MEVFETYTADFQLARISKDWKQAATEYWEACGYRLEKKAPASLVFHSIVQDGIAADDLNNIKRKVEISQEGEILNFKISALQKFNTPNEEKENLVHFLFDAEANGFLDILSGLSETSDVRVGKWHLRFAVLVVVLCIAGLGVYLNYDSIFGSASHIEISNGRVEQIVASQKGAPADVWIVPFSDFQHGVAVPLAARLSEDLDITVRVSAPLPLPKSGVYNAATRRFDAVRLGGRLKEFSANLPEKKENCIFIALLGSPLETADSSPNEIVFAYEADGRHSIIGTHEFGSYSTLLAKERTYKMLKRMIGVQYYHHNYSLRTSSVMFSPVRTLFVIDRMKYHY